MRLRCESGSDTQKVMAPSPAQLVVVAGVILGAVALGALVAVFVLGRRHGAKSARADDAASKGAPDVVGDTDEPTDDE